MVPSFPHLATTTNPRKLKPGLKAASQPKRTWFESSLLLEASQFAVRAWTPKTQTQGWIETG